MEEGWGSGPQSHTKAENQPSSFSPAEHTGLDVCLSLDIQSPVIIRVIEVIEVIEIIKIIVLMMNHVSEL